LHLEIYERVRLGNGAGPRDWIPVSRGFAEDRERADDHVRVPATSEAYIRNQFAAWAGYMGAA
jgi:hypothetical protein